jgi:glycosyltransferase involved in cell wall biosynthesis
MYAEAYGQRPDDFRKSSEYLQEQRVMSLFTRDAHVLLPYSVRAALQRQLDYAAVRRTHHILTNSPYIATKAAQIYRHRSIHNVWAGVLPNAQTSTYEPLIIVPSRLEKIKNIEIVLHAVRLLVSAGEWLNNWQVVIIGDGTDAKRLHALAKTLNIETQVTFSGYIASDVRDAYYARASWVVYPSLAEPLGLPVAEAAMSYKATIADAQGGPAAMIRNGESGLVINMSQPQALAEALHWAMRHPQEAQQWGQAAYAHLAPTMRYDHWAVNFCQTVRRLMDDKSQ